MTFPLVPVRRAARMLNGGTPPSGVAEFWDGEVPFVTPPDLNGLDGAPLEYTTRTITADGVAHSGLAPAGSVLLSTRAPIGHIGRLTSPAAFNQGCRALVPAPNQEPRFLAYSLVAARADMDARGLGTTFLELSGSSLAQIEVPLAPLEAQRAIADYLDRETAQIDAFIAKSEELITILTERRAAVMDEALVRAGAAAPAMPLKRAVDFVTVGIVVTPARWYAESGVPALRGLNVKPGSLSTDDLVYLSAEGHRANRKSELRAGDVLVVRTGQAGAAAVVPAELDGANAIDLLIVRPGGRVVSEFLAHFINSDSTSRLIAHGSVGSIQGHFNVGSLRELPFPLLSRDDQWALVRTLDEQAGNIDEAIVIAHRGVALARERRAALVSAAVTGKIDVGVVA